MSLIFASGGQSFSISTSNEYSGLISFRISPWDCKSDLATNTTTKGERDTLFLWQTLHLWSLPSVPCYWAISLVSSTPHQGTIRCGLVVASWVHLAPGHLASCSHPIPADTAHQGLD